MKIYKVISGELHFNYLSDISYDIQKLGVIFQNDGVDITQRELQDFNKRYQEVVTQLETWHKEALSKFEEK